MNEERKPLEVVSEDVINKVRRLFGPRLAARIEKLSLDIPYPESEFQVLTRSTLTGTRSAIEDHIGLLIDTFAPTIEESAKNEAIAKIVVATHEFIVAEIERLPGYEREDYGEGWKHT